MCLFCDEHGTKSGGRRPRKEMMIKPLCIKDRQSTAPQTTTTTSNKKKANQKQKPSSSFLLVLLLLLLPLLPTDTSNDCLRFHHQPNLLPLLPSNDTLHATIIMLRSSFLFIFFLPSSLTATMTHRSLCVCAFAFVGAHTRRRCGTRPMQASTQLLLTLPLTAR